MKHAVLLFSALVLVSCRDEQALGPRPVPGFGVPAAIVPDGILKSPRGITTDRQGNVWVADTYNDRLAVFSPGGSQAYSLPLSPRPGPMGLDRSTGDVLTSTSTGAVYRIIPQTQQISRIVALSPGTVDASAVFDVNTANQRSRLITTISPGDIDGSPSGQIFASSLVNGRETVLLKVRGAGATAMAYSSYPPVDSLNRSSGFVAGAREGYVYTAFVIPDNALRGFPAPYLFLPDDAFLSRPFIGGEEAGSVFAAGGMNEEGLIAVADPVARTIVVLRAAPEGVLTVLTLPPVDGLPVPTPTDAAVGSDGSIYVTVRDDQDAGNTRGAVLRYPRVR